MSHGELNAGAGLESNQTTTEIDHLGDWRRAALGIARLLCGQRQYSDKKQRLLVAPTDMQSVALWRVSRPISDLLCGMRFCEYGEQGAGQGRARHYRKIRRDPLDLVEP